MALPNPAMNPPRLPPSPTKRSLHSRSPSRSPVRQFHLRDTDPLLRDLSPTHTLRTFSQRSDEVHSEHLNRSIETASHAERALGVKAAQACVDLRSWVRELEGWEWPGTFEEPEPVRKKQRMSSMSVSSMISRPSLSQVEEEGGEEFWGSLPAPTVRGYEQRVEEISEGLDEIDVEELKDFVLSAHSQAGYGEASIDDSIGAIGADTNLKRLDDFTALITATILQALPYLSRLTRLLHTWTLRLSILRSTPAYLRDLKQARTDMDHGWAALAVSSHPAAADALWKSNATFSRETMEEMKRVVEKQVYSLGRRLDGFLDQLEGRQECVPDRWIEDFEVLEEQYGVWVVQAERKVLEGEWRMGGEEEAGDVVSDDEDRPDTARTITMGPTMTTATTVGTGLSTQTNTSMHSTSTGPLKTTVTTTTPHNSTPRELAEPNSNRSSAMSGSSSPTRQRSRHVPIVIDEYKNLQQQQPPIELPSDLPSSTSRTSPLPTPNSATEPESSVKQRAAFLNGEIEKGDGLIKSKSPPIVRPFEHASNAFTRLFKRDALAEKEKAKAKEEGLTRSSSAKDDKRNSGKEKKDGASSRSSQLSSGSSGSKGSKRTSTRGRGSLDTGGKMQYGDMVYVPEPILEEKESRRGRGRARGDSRPKTPKTDSKKLEYFDMVRMPERWSEENSRPTEETMPSASKREKREKNARSLEYGDMMSTPEAPREESARRSQLKRNKSSEGSKSARNLQYGDLMHVPESQVEQSGRRRERASSSSKKEDKSSRSLERSKMVPKPEHSSPETKRTMPDTLTKQDILNLPEPRPAQTKRSSKQNITALPQLQSVAKNSAPETYKPTGLNSPFHSPIEPEQGFDFPADWPLSTTQTPQPTPSPSKEMAKGILGAEGEDSASETHEPGDAFAANNFDQMFVKSIPSSPVKRPVAGYTTHDSPEEKQVRFRDVVAAAPAVSRQTAPEEGLVWNEKPLPDRSWMRTGGSSQSRRLDWTESTQPRPVSMVEEAEEEEDNSSIASSETEEFGIVRDNAASYFGGVKSSGSGSGSGPGVPRVSSSRTTPPSVKTSQLQRSKSTPPVSPVLLKLRIPDAEAGAPASEQAEEGNAGLVRRASTASIENHPRSELKEIEVVRRSSTSSAPQTPLAVSAPTSAAVEGRGSLDATRSPTSPLKYKGAIVFPSPPSVPPRGSSLQASPEAKAKRDSGELNAAMPKRKYKDIPKGQRDGVMASPAKKEKQPLKPGEDNFDRHVSEVLDRVHAPIRFKTRPGAETPQQQRSSAKLPKAADRPGKNLTLAPAEPSPKKATPADPEVKLYHLTQAGRAEPIKLYVRLVGEGERVMVRVGGGWADLADYLRQYAEHHGSRTVSESVLELQTASANSSANGKRTFSGPAEPKARTPVTPASAFPTLERPRTSDSSNTSWLSRPQPEFSMGESDEEQSPSIAHHRDTAFGTQRSTPKSASRPSTAQSNSSLQGHASSLRQLDSEGNSPATAVGLAGVGGKIKADLPEQKARWVEGMIQQVNKSASAEKGREEREKYFGEMGKVGGTRRVMFRSSSGVQQ